MTKEEKIHEVLGGLSINADANGWLKLGIYIPIDLGLQSSETENNTEIGIWRPKSLQGIETNNFWIKIESEEDLPKETGTYFTFSNVWWKPFYRIDVFTGRLKNSFTDGKSCFTHYQPITKPEPPLY